MRRVQSRSITIDLASEEKTLGNNRECNHRTGNWVHAFIRFVSSVALNKTSVCAYSTKEKLTTQLPCINVVILNTIGRPHHLHIFQARNRAQHGLLNFLWYATRHTVGVYHIWKENQSCPRTARQQSAIHLSRTPPARATLCDAPSQIAEF